MNPETAIIVNDREPVRINRNPLDEVQVGDYYWINFWDEKDGARVDEHEELMCVEKIGTNHVAFVRSGSHGGKSLCKVHFDHFERDCRPEPRWKDVLTSRMEETQKAIREKTRQLIEEGRKLCLLPPVQDQPPPESQSFLPVKVSGDPKRYQKSLVQLQEKLPEIEKEITELGEEFAVVCRDMAMPDLIKLGAVKTALEVVEDRIFTIELYCGILESAVQIAKGEPAPISTPIVIRQQMLYMDEETLFDYQDGGMDFTSMEKFDEWVVQPENLNRVLPDQRGIVAFRVRRNEKDYGQARSFFEAWSHMMKGEANKQTYLLIRNGGNVYRIASEVDFSPRLIPKEGEIGKDQFTKISERYLWDEFDEHGFRKREVKEELVTPNSLEFDDHLEKANKLLRHYNRIVILVQGLLDRSPIFHPHIPINLRSPEDMEKWIILIRDEERGLPANRVSWDEYRKQLNSTLKKGKWVYVDSSYDEGYANGERPYRESESNWRTPRRRGWAAYGMPDLCMVDSMKRDGSKVRVSWPWGRLAKGRGRWVENHNRPGWGHTEYDYDTDRMCHEWIPVDRVLNVSDYKLGDYKLFLCDRALLGEYLKWAQYLLTAEDWARDRKKGIPPEKDAKAKARE